MLHGDDDNFTTGLELSSIIFTTDSGMRKA